MEQFRQSTGFQVIREWMEQKDQAPFSFQEETWLRFEEGYSGLVVAPTGFGKTYSVFLGLLIHFMNHPEQYQYGLKLLWVTPLRSLAKDLARAMREAIGELGLDWVVGVRNGDTSTSERQKQTRSMPDVLVITPESLHLLLAQKEHTRFFKTLHCIAVDEWHELLGNKRGILTELALSRLKAIRPGLRIWGITATIGNLEEALDVLIPEAQLPKATVLAREKKLIDIESVFPERLEILPWAGHLGGSMADKIIPIILESRTTLIFTNTRGQSEMWFQLLLEHHPDLAGQLALHHGSVDAAQRAWIEENLSSGYLKAVICTSSLDLGVDFKPVDTVIQIGSPKGVARFLQRAGRSGHSPFETSRIWFVPTHSLELLESAALQEAVKQGVVEQRQPLALTFDVLIQYLVTLAVGDGFRPEQLFPEIKQTHAFRYLNEDEWLECLHFITRGGNTLNAYTEYHRVVVEEGVYKVKSRRIALLHRLNIGVIVSDSMIRVKFISGGYIGMIEEYFISRLQPGEHFVLAGRVLEFIMIRDMTVLVRRSKATKAHIPSWEGGRMPLSSHLSRFLRERLAQSAGKPQNQPELNFLQPLLQRQLQSSDIPKEDELLIELIKTRDGYHLFVYPFEGRQMHEAMSALLAYRISRIRPISFSIAMNDYGFELLSDQPIPLDEENVRELLSEEQLLEDVGRSINAAEMALRKFRDIACISGLVLQHYPGERKMAKSLQASSSIIFRVLEEHEPNHLLLKQAYGEVFQQEVQDVRLQNAFRRIAAGRIEIRRPKSFTPLSFPIKVDSMRQHLSSEALEERIRKMQEDAYKS